MACIELVFGLPGRKIKHFFYRRIQSQKIRYGHPTEEVRKMRTLILVRSTKYQENQVKDVIEK
jgi:hypothetical protein